MSVHGTTVGVPPRLDHHHWLPAGAGWHAVHVWAMTPDLPDSYLRHRTYQVVAWQCSGDDRGPLDGVPVARNGRLVALDLPDAGEQVSEHVEVAHIASRRRWHDPGVSDLERRAYGVLEARRHRAEAAVNG